MCVRLSAALLLAAGLTGCENQVASADPLAGPIPECKELTSAALKSYVDQARKACESTPTAADRSSNKGCEIVQRQGQCIAKSMFPGG